MNKGTGIAAITPGRRLHITRVDSSDGKKLTRHWHFI